MRWILDKSHSEVQFKVKHMLISTISGDFTEFDANALSDNTDFKNAEFELTANVDSINTRNDERDTHLKSDDFFNASDYPILSFTGGNWVGDTLKGEISIKGVRKSIELAVNFGGVIVDSNGNTRAGFEFSDEINRKDFGLNWSEVTENGGLVVSDNVKSFVNLEFIKQ